MILRLLLAFCLSSLLAFAPAGARAAEGIELIEASLEATDDGYRLSSNFTVDLTRSLEDALMAGVPLYFNLQVEVSRPRWYWFDEVAAKATRRIRLSYNLLTQQYRASIDGSLHRNFARLDDMLALLRRPGRWTIVDSAALQRDATYTVAVQMSLDVSQLPKPIQVSAMGSGDWRMSSGWTRFAFRADGR
ncbi:MAG: DUF4390 domain-containing protein [Burkholderiaceae bacterium]|nr:DUF4390 domain-containing protein [Burkholderiaceae bacterium]